MTSYKVIPRHDVYHYQIREEDDGVFCLEYVEGGKAMSVLRVNDMEIDSFILALQQARDAYRAEVERHQ